MTLHKKYATHYQRLLCVALCLLSACAYAGKKQTAVAIPPFAQVFSVQDIPYNEVQEELLLALEDHGIVLSYHAHVADMLSRTVADVGYTDKVYQHADIFGFCKADLSNATVRENPHYLVLCPFYITIYQLTGETQVYLSYRTFPQLPKTSAWHDVERLLRALITSTGAIAVQHE